MYYELFQVRNFAKNCNIRVSDPNVDFSVVDQEGLKHAFVIPQFVINATLYSTAKETKEMPSQIHNSEMSISL